MPSIKVLKANGELVEEFELTEKDDDGYWIASSALEAACMSDGDIIQLPIGKLITQTITNLGSKALTKLGYSDNPKITYTGTVPIFDIKTARKSLLSRAIRGINND